MVGCKNCSSNLHYEIAIKKLKCNFCKTFYELEDAEELWLLEENEEKTEEEKKECMEIYVFRCEFCGGLLYGDRQNMGGGFCRYCGIATETDGHRVTIPRPEKMILFEKTRKESERILQGMLRKVLYLPDEYRDKEHKMSLKPIYVPYRVVSEEPEAGGTGKGKNGGGAGGTGKGKNGSGAGGTGKGKNSGGKRLVHEDTAMFHDEICDAVGEFRLSASIDFAPIHTTDFYLDVPAPKKEAVFELSPEGRREVKKGDDTVFCPVWFMSYGDGERVAYAAINGQTGKIAASLPVEFNKFLLLSVVLLFPFYYLLENMLFFVPAFLFLMLGGIGAVCGIYFLCVQAEKIMRREGSIVGRAAGKNEREKGEKPRGKKQFLWGKRGFFGGMILLGGVAVFAGCFLWKIAGILSAVFFFLLLILQVFFMKKFLRGRDALKRKGIFLRGTRAGFVCLPALLVAGIVAALQPLMEAWYYGICLILLGSTLFELLAYVKNYNFLVTKKIVPRRDKGGGSRG